MRNPTRRNRNIGQAWSGHGDTNKFEVPQPWVDPNPYWLTLRDPVRVIESGFTFWVEAPTAGHLHYVTIDDAVRVLQQLPPDDLHELRTILLRQPTRKQRVLAAVWGRYVYSTDLAEGLPAIVLEAQGEEPLRWSRRLGQEDTAELARLASDGHRIERTRRHAIVHRTAESNRSTQLFRSLLHEVGHHVQYLRQVLDGDDDGYQARRDRHFARPQREREDFAHLYAERVGAGIERFAPLGARGLPPEWFAYTPSA